MPSVISIDGLPKNPIIGFVYGGCKGWMQCLKFGSDEFKMFGVQHGHEVANPETSGVGNGNGWGSAGSLKTNINYLSSNGGTLYLFDCDAELFAWLAKPL